eukprot:1629022-Pleurochrysis_carterae.AAC.1
MAIKAAHRASVVKLSALPVGEKLVAVLDDLVRAHHEVKVVLLQKLANHVRTKRVRDAAVVLGPARNVRLRIGPEQIAQKPCKGAAGQGPGDE